MTISIPRDAIDAARKAAEVVGAGSPVSQGQPKRVDTGAFVGPGLAPPQEQAMLSDRLGEAYDGSSKPNARTVIGSVLFSETWPFHHGKYNVRLKSGQSGVLDFDNKSRVFTSGLGMAGTDQLLSWDLTVGALKAILVEIEMLSPLASEREYAFKIFKEFFSGLANPPQTFVEMADYFKNTRFSSAPPTEVKPPCCKRCGQIDHGQHGEYPCPECGLPTAHDETPTPTDNKPGTLSHFLCAEYGYAVDVLKECFANHKNPPKTLREMVDSLRGVRVSEFPQATLAQPRVSSSREMKNENLRAMAARGELYTLSLRNGRFYAQCVDANGDMPMPAFEVTDVAN